jgi:uncharacterized membrane protein
MSVSATAEDFNVEVKSDTIETCKCTNGETSFTVSNTGAIVSNFHISTEGEASNWVTILEDEFLLQPGEEKTVTMMVNVPCSGKINNELLTHIFTELKTATTIKQNIKLKTCTNAEITTSTPKIINCPAATSTYAFTIKNAGDYFDTFDLSMEPFPENAILSDGLLFLEPGEQQMVYAFVTMPPEFLDVQEFTFKARGRNSKVVSSLVVELQTKKCYNYTVDIPEALTVCQETITEETFKINADIEMSNAYEVQLSGAEFVTLEQNASKLSLIFDTNNIELGSYLITTKIKNKIGSIEKEFTTNVTVEDCYSLNINALDAYKIVACEENLLTLDVKNKGSKDGEYTFNTEGPWWVESQPYLQIDSKEIKQLKLFFNAPCEKAWSGVILNAESMDSNYETEKQISLKLESADKAYELDLDSKNKYISFYPNKANITVTHEGFKAANYKIDLLAPNWITLDQDAIYLKPGETKTINLTIDTPSELEFSKYDTTLTFKPKNSDAEYKTNFKVSVTNDPWWAQWCWLVILIIALIVAAIIIFLIWLLKRRPARPRRKHSRLISIFKSTSRKVKKGKRWWLALLIIAIIVLCLLLVKFFAMPPVAQSDQEMIDFSYGNLYGEDGKIYFFNDRPFAIPFKFNNPKDSEIFYNIEGPEYIEWIFPNKRWVSLPANGSEDMNLIILGENQTETVDYTITVSEVEDGVKNKVGEKTLTLVPTEDYAKKFWWLILLIPLLIVAILLLVLGLRKSHKTKKRKGIAFKKHRRWPWILLLIVIILLILALVTWFTAFKDNAPALSIDQHLDEALKPSIEVDDSNLNMMGNALILANEVVNLPIIISNFYPEAASYEFLTSKIDWITLSTESIIIDPADSEIVFLNIDARNQSKQEINYTILANIEAGKDEYVETTEFNIKVTGLGKSKARIIIFSIITALVVLLIISIIFVAITHRKASLYKELRLRRKNGK